MDDPETPARRDGQPSKRRRRRLGLIAALVAASAAFAIGKVADAVRIELAEREIVVGRLDDAQGRLDALIARHPMRPRPWFLVARVARLQSRITDAEEALGRAVALGMPIDEARPEHDALVALGEPEVDRRTGRLEPKPSTVHR